MKNTINLSFLSNALQFRFANLILNALLLLVVLVTIPLLLILGIATLLIIAVVARFRTVTHFYRSERNKNTAGPVHFEPHNSADDRDGFADYSIIEEKIGR